MALGSQKRQSLKITAGHAHHRGEDFRCKAAATSINQRGTPPGLGLYRLQVLLTERLDTFFDCDPRSQSDRPFFEVGTTYFTSVVTNRYQFCKAFDVNRRTALARVQRGAIMLGLIFTVSDTTLSRCSFAGYMDSFTELEPV